MKTYAAIYNDEDIREKSSSGGIFSVIASQYDVVYGVAMTEDCYGCEFIRVEDKVELLRGSKYLQAKIGDTFRTVKADLLKGKKVLFSGTGCQINGLSAFLGKNYDNLLLLDIVCHGTPSPKLWKQYAIYQEKKYGKLKTVEFRCKENDWKDFCMKENQQYIPKDQDPFMRMFLRNYCLRPSCYDCHAKYYKKADITIADFWGIEKVAPEMSDGRGTSLVMVRTDKGQILFNEVLPYLKWKEVSYEEGVRGNTAEYTSVPRPPERNMFFEDLNEKEFDEIVKKYAADIIDPIYIRIARKIKHFIKNMRGGAKLEKNNSNYGICFTFKL